MENEMTDEIASSRKRRKDSDTNDEDTGRSGSGKGKSSIVDINTSDFKTSSFALQVSNKFRKVNDVRNDHADVGDADDGIENCDISTNVPSKKKKQLTEATFRSTKKTDAFEKTASTKAEGREDKKQLSSTDNENYPIDVNRLEVNNMLTTNLNNFANEIVNDEMVGAAVVSVADAAVNTDPVIAADVGVDADPHIAVDAVDTDADVSTNVSTETSITELAESIRSEDISPRVSSTPDSPREDDGNNRDSEMYTVFHNLHHRMYRHLIRRAQSVVPDSAVAGDAAATVDTDDVASDVPTVEDLHRRIFHNILSPNLSSDSSTSSSNTSPDHSMLPDSLSSTPTRQFEEYDARLGFFNFDSGPDSVDFSDDDNELNEDLRTSNERDKKARESAKELLMVDKSPYTWISHHELVWREHGFSAKCARSLPNGLSHDFNARYYASRHVIERMQLSHRLRGHHGCVNCLNFSRSGDVLCSGSDDLNIIIWDWAKNKTLISFPSGHLGNIFQTKFLNTDGCFIVISASRDARVLRSVIPSWGGEVQTEHLYEHSGSIHKLVISPQTNHEIISVSEDSYVKLFDLRSNAKAVDLTKVVTKNKRKVRLYSISHHPFAPEFCVSGNDSEVRVYDKRNANKPVQSMQPNNSTRNIQAQVTCVVYNSTGSEILASYSSDCIYLFDNKSYKPGEYLHLYRGHYNNRTIKGVNFMGPNSEYVISGSDCGHIFYWDKNTEAIINFMVGDTHGVVNCLEPHPTIPVLATSGLRNDVKIWTPTSTVPPNLSHLEHCIYRNIRYANAHSMQFDHEFHYFVNRFLHAELADAASNDSNNSDNSNSNSSSTNSFSSTEMENLRCRTQ